MPKESKMSPHKIRKIKGIKDVIFQPFSLRQVPWHPRPFDLLTKRFAVEPWTLLIISNQNVLPELKKQPIMYYYIMAAYIFKSYMHKISKYFY